MNKRQLRFIALLSFLGVLVFLAGEVLLLVFDNASPTVSKVWLAIVVILTLAISLWKSARDFHDNP